MRPFCTACAAQVASDLEHEDETACSLDFGARIATVTNAAAVVVGADATDEADSLRYRLDVERTRLDRLGDDGYGEWWSDDPRYAHEIQMLKDNLRRFHKENAAARRAQIDLVEATSRNASADAVAAIASRKAKAEKEAQNYREIVDRQKTIDRIYRAPKPAYAQQAAVVRQLEMELSTLAPPQP